MERMTLSLLRARIRAGAYQDDQYTEQDRHLLFLRWLVRQGQLNEWHVTDEERHEEQSNHALAHTEVSKRSAMSEARRLGDPTRPTTSA